MSNDKFEWDEKLVLEFAERTTKRFAYPNQYGGWSGIVNELEQFKKEQLSKRDWEIVKWRDVDSGGIYETKVYNRNTEIHSVRRLSDGEIFCVGDEIEWGSCSLDGKMVHHKEKIVGFEIKEGDMYAIATDQYLVHYKILKKAKKQVLFTTEDGVDIYDGETFYEVCISDVVASWSMMAESVLHKPPYDKYYKYFSTRQVAEEFILMNKPMLSLKEILDNLYSWEEFKKQCLAHTEVFAKEDAKSSPLFKRLKQLAKSKMDKK